MHKHADFTFSCVRCGAVVTCTAVSYQVWSRHRGHRCQFVCPTPRRGGLSYSMHGQTTSCRASCSSRVAEASKKAKEGMRRMYSGRPPPWRNKRSLVTLCRPVWKPWYLDPHEIIFFQTLEAVLSLFRLNQEYEY